MIRILVVATTLLLVFQIPARADTLRILQTRLTEEADQCYIETEVPVAWAPSIREPILPAGCVLTGEPEYRRQAGRMVIRFRFTRKSESFAAADVLLLPWGNFGARVDGVFLTTQWKDGSIRRGLFARGPIGIRVPLETLLTQRMPLEEVAYYNFTRGLYYVVIHWQHLLFGVALGLLGNWRWLRPTLIFVAGHAISMVIIESGLIGLPLPLAEGLIGLAATIVTVAAIRETRRLEWMLIVVGLLHGTAIAASIDRTQMESRDFLSAVFCLNLGIDVSIFAVAGGVAALMYLIREWGKPILAVGVGTASVTAALLALSSEMPSKSPEAAQGVVIPPSSSGGAGPAASGTTRMLKGAFANYVIIEEDQIRHEVLVRVKNLNTRESSGLMIEESEQEELLRVVTEWIDRNSIIEIDGEKIPPAERNSVFVAITQNGVKQQSKKVPQKRETAIIGMTFIYDMNAPPNTLSLYWNLFSPNFPNVPTIMIHGNTWQENALSAKNPVQHWIRPTNIEVTAPLSPVSITPPHTPVLSIVLVLVGMMVAIVAFAWEIPRLGTIVVPALLIVAAVTYPFVRSPVTLPVFFKPTLATEDSNTLLERLLKNVYDSSAFRDEDTAYDGLAQSVSGEQLKKIYLMSRRALELENQGGIRIRVQHVDVVKITSTENIGDGVFSIDATWTVAGSGTQFGHTHFRQKRYRAKIILAIDGNAWMIRDVEILEEEREL